MGGWAEFAAAFALFLLSHAVPARPGVKARLTGALGQKGYLAAYVTVSLALLAWLIGAAGRAPFVALWPPAPWQLWLPNLVMPVVCLLVAGALGAPNPLSFGGAGDARFDPDRPGIVGLTRHPLPVALALWALAHAAANPDLAHLLLFGGFAGFALAGTVVIDRRNRRRMGPDWDRLAARTATLPLAALVSGRWRPSGPPPLGRLGLGLLLWAGLLAAHRPVIGVSPLPF
ncbi:NnrU family protein [Rhodovulum kholense]|uniref:Putative membrane protein n=1 Tax=Rhodovulum kholense TaxID=453584 RepID=A0A8E3APH0_9RHOB|nr:NnrU family protein [Rhodovulum kholense]PTW45245.1 putative membrane protein [Rhodovulum kholense]